MARLKRRLHQAPPADNAAGAVAPGLAGLDVVVAPPLGMSVLVDNSVLGHASPVRSRRLEPGPHRVNVRAMGYFDVDVPINLEPGQILHLPVALRPRAPRPMPSAATQDDLRSGPGEQNQDEPASRRALAAPSERRGESALAAPVPSPQTSGTLLPEIAAIALHMVAQPPAPIVVDNEATDGRSVRLRRERGTLAVGPLVLTYTVSPGQLVDFLVPSDGCQWYRDGAQVKPGSALRLGRGLVRLRRVPSGGREQAVVLRRLG